MGTGELFGHSDNMLGSSLFFLGGGGGGGGVVIQSVLPPLLRKTLSCSQTNL